MRYFITLKNIDRFLQQDYSFNDSQLLLEVIKISNKTAIRFISLNN